MWDEPPPAAPSVRPGGLRAWLVAARLPTLPAAVVPVVVGTATALDQGRFKLLPFFAALAAALLIQVGTNLANDYFDYRKGADTSARLGPMRVTQSGLIAPEAVRNGMILVFALAALIGLYLVSVGGWPILLIGLASIATGILYTGGPWPLGYHGLGDLFVFVFFGVVAVVGTCYLHTGALSVAALINSVPVGFLVTAILVVNNLRDVETDRAAGKRTLAVMIGRTGTRVEYALLLAGAYLVPLFTWLAGVAGSWFWLPWVSLPLAIPLLLSVFRREGPALNASLRDTARLHLIFGVLFAESILA